MYWFLKCLRQYADFHGRARRKEYWYFTLFYLLFMIVLAFILYAATWSITYSADLALWVACMGILIWSLACVIPSLAVAVRRLHDTGRRGWTMLYVIVPSLISSGASPFAYVSTLALWLNILASIITMIAGITLVVFYCQDGEEGENQWGANPKEVAEES